MNIGYETIDGNVYFRGKKTLKLIKDKERWTPKREFESGYYNKNMKRIDPDEKGMGAILYVTKDFESLKDFLKKFKKSKKRVDYGLNDVIVDVFNGWLDIDIKVYAKIDYKKRHQDYLKELKK